jgi:tRNA threonylcarbamoyladenosine biosynthesis protein TsaB
MSKILYLDTSEMMAHLAIFEAEKKVAEEKWEAGRELSATLNDRFQSLLKEVGISSNDLSGICVFVGPGSFTGLRIGLSFANGLAFALSIPIYETKEKETIELSDPREIALPFYGAEPKITEAKKRK